MLVIKPKIITPPAAPLLSLATVRAQCEVVAIEVDSDGVESHPDDALLLQKLEEAVEYAEGFTGLSFSIRTLEIALDGFPEEGVELPGSPVIEIVSLTYVDADGNPQEVDAADFTLDTHQMPNWLLPASGFTWPATSDVVNSVKVRYRAGHSSEGEADSDAEILPARVRSAVLLHAAALYRDREGVAIPPGVHSLLRPFRVKLGMA